MGFVFLPAFSLHPHMHNPASIEMWCLLTPPAPYAGYFTRVSALEHIVAAFLERVTGACLPRANLVLLGAGLDTLSFRLLEAGRQLSSPTATDGTTPATRAVAAATAEAGLALSCFEVDLAPVALYKASCLRASAELLSAVGGEQVEETGKEAQETQGGVPVGLEAAATVVFRGAGGYALIAGNLSNTAGLEGGLPHAHAHKKIEWTCSSSLNARQSLVESSLPFCASCTQRLSTRRDWTGPRRRCWWPSAYWCTCRRMRASDCFVGLLRASARRTAPVRRWSPTT